MHPLYGTEDGTVYVEYEPDRLDGVFIHLELNNWSVSKYKQYRRIWNNLVRILRRKGINNIYAIPPSPKEEKLIKMFGFKDTGILLRGNKLLSI